MTFETFSPLHLAIVAAVPAVARGLASLARRRPGAARPVRLALAAGIALNELAWYGYVVRRGWFDPPVGLPLDLCDVVLWLTVVALVAPRPWLLEIVYFLGIAGSGMAVLTPDFGAERGSYPAVKFFAAHGAVVAAVLFLVWTGALRPRPRAWLRVFLAVNAYALLVLVFDLATGTNYMYLREKPSAGSLLDLLGPWPWYLLGGEAVALLLLWLLQLPFRRPDRAGLGGATRGRALG